MAAAVWCVALHFNFMRRYFKPFPIDRALHPPLTVSALDMLNGGAILLIAAGAKGLVRHHPSPVEFIVKFCMLLRMLPIRRKAEGAH